MATKERLNAMKEGKILMMPQMLYAQGWIFKDGEIHTYVVGNPDEVETDGEMLDYLDDEDENVVITTKDEFIGETVSAYMEYFWGEDEDDYDGPALTDKTCNRCGSLVLKETDPDSDYPYLCLNCDENMYSFEVSDV